MIFTPQTLAIDAQAELVKAFVVAKNRPSAPEYVDHVGMLRLPEDSDYDATLNQVGVLAAPGRTFEHGILLDTIATITTYSPSMDRAWGLAEWAALVVRSSPSLVHGIAHAETSGIRLVETPTGDRHFCYSFTADVRMKSSRMATI